MTLLAMAALCPGLCVRAAEWLQLIWVTPRINSLPLDVARSVVLHPGTKALFELKLDQSEPTTVVVVPNSYGVLHGHTSPTYRACFWHRGRNSVLGGECRTSSMGATTFVIPPFITPQWKKHRHGHHSGKNATTNKHKNNDTREGASVLVAVTPDNFAWANFSVRACTGEGCEAPCPTPCARHSRCEHRTGTCRCSRGHTGANCALPIVSGIAPPYRHAAGGVWRIEQNGEDAWDSRHTRIRYAVLVLGLCTAACTGLLAALLSHVTNRVKLETTNV